MLSRVTSCKQFRAHFRLCQVKNHVQTARESHDLNMGLFVLLTAASNSFAKRILCKNSVLRRPNKCQQMLHSSGYHDV